MALMSPTAPSETVGRHVPTGLPRLVAWAMVTVGLMVPVLMQWSISSLADEMALEISVPEPFAMFDLTTSNLMIGERPLATARVAQPRFAMRDRDVEQAVADATAAIDAHLVDQGFTSTSYERNAWSKVRADDFDETNLALRAEGERLYIDATPFDIDYTMSFPIFLAVAFALVLTGGSVLTARRPSLLRVSLTTAIAMLSAATTTIAVRGLHQAKNLIEAHVANHGPVPTDTGGKYDIAYMGTEAEQLLMLQLGTAEWVYPFGVLGAVLSLVVGAIAIQRLVRSRIANRVVGIGAGLTLAAIIGSYGPTGVTVARFIG